MTGKMNLEAFLNEGALLGAGNGCALVGWGPFRARRQPRAGVLTFYTPDFFLTDPAPWKEPAGWCECDVGTLATTGEAPSIRWQPPSHAAFAEIFSTLLKRIHVGELTKIVPVMFEGGEMTHGERLLPWCLSQLRNATPEVWPYGFWDTQSGMIGVTPEIFFEKENDVVKTMSLAGTAPLSDKDRLVSQLKEKREHSLVVHGIRERFAPFGDVEVDREEILEIGPIAHLRTTMTVKLHRDVACEDLIAVLHPTPALGAVPRERGMALLRECDRSESRQAFGAPFGVVRPDGHARFVVAIRGLQWEWKRVRIGSGCGLVEGSTLPGEWEELRLKRESVKKMFQLT